MTATEPTPPITAATEATYQHALRTHPELRRRDPEHTRRMTQMLRELDTIAAHEQFDMTWLDYVDMEARAFKLGYPRRSLLKIAAVVEAEHTADGTS